VRVHVAFTPAEAAEAPTGIVVDVLRATSTIVQALASGYRRVLCCAAVEDAERLRAGDPEGVVLAGERGCVRIPGFDLGNSPREFLEPQGETLVLTTTNGTRALVTAAERCGRVVAGSLMNLEAVVAGAREIGDDVAVFCAGVKGEFTIDDAYCAGRIAERLGGELSDAAAAAIRIAGSFGTPEEGLGASKSARNLVDADLSEDIAYCARESVLGVVPRIVRVEGPAVELVT
jgi:2-phosphosulfolactate phosphatase